MSENICVDLGSRSYTIVIGTDALDGVGASVSEWWAATFGDGGGERTLLLVTDQNVARYHSDPVAASLTAAGWRVKVAVVPAGEETKSPAHLQRLYDDLVSLPADRRSVVAAVGGGVVGDLAGFAAATFNRGIPLVQVPTTLLAQVDSSVGGKTGINHAQGKNLIGAFHQPLGVFIDTNTLNTLPDRDYRAGLAEVVKYGIIMDEPFLTWLEDNIQPINNRDAAALRYLVRRCCELKAEVVAEDEHETSGRRAILNYGHTFAHAYEALTEYGRLLHGEAVSIGMIDAGELARRLGRVDAEFCARQSSLLSALGLPVELPPDCQFDPEAVLGRMKLDKKTVGNRLRFVLPVRMGHVEVVRDVPEPDVIACLTRGEAA